jgi:outer membrane protein
MKTWKSPLLATVMSACLLGAAFVPVAASAEGQSPWLVRLRGLDVVPHESATISAIGGDVSINTKIVPEADFSYFFTDNIAAELILATSKHNITAVGTSLGNVDVGSVWLLPPTLTLQYHFMPDQTVRPYVGAGVNYTIFYRSHAAGGAVTNVDYSNSFGPAVQAGVDVMLDQHWLINFDVKKIWIGTNARLNGGAIEAKTKIDPWIFGVGVGYRF